MTALLAILFWALTALAGLAMLNGDPTAINGVVGAGACAVVCTLLAIIDRD